MGASVAYHLAAARLARRRHPRAQRRSGRGEHRPGHRRVSRAVCHARSTCGSRCSRGRSSVASKRRPAWIPATRRAAISGSPATSASLPSSAPGSWSSTPRDCTRRCELGPEDVLAMQSRAGGGGHRWRRLLSQRRLHPPASHPGGLPRRGRSARRSGGVGHRGHRASPFDADGDHLRGTDLARDDRRRGGGERRRRLGRARSRHGPAWTCR